MGYDYYVHTFDKWIKSYSKSVIMAHLGLNLIGLIAFTNQTSELIIVQSIRYHKKKCTFY